MNLLASTDAHALAAVHALSFDDPWSDGAFAELFASPGVFALAADDGDEIAAFILCRAVAGEAEVLTLAVAPDLRRRGMATALLQAAMAEASRAGAETMFLEVASNNAPALALYRGAGFTQAGLRRAYYAPEGTDALVLRRDLNRPPAADYVSAEPRSD
ncbi:MAG: ribosomal protein S18-alanine N-acetyltransferase [Caulobacteraceae bacterium]